MDDDLIKHFISEAKDIKATQVYILQEIASLKVKSSIWGGVGGLMVATSAVLFSLLRG